jgi:hypothetical protein
LLEPLEFLLWDVDSVGFDVCHLVLLGESIMLDVRGIIA